MNVVGDFTQRLQCTIRRGYALGGMIACLVSTAQTPAGYLLNVEVKRDNGSPITESFLFSFRSAGELRIQNTSLGDGSVELSASSELELDGLRFWSPLGLEPGGTYLRELGPGTHVLKVTLRGKPGGALRLTAQERAQQTIGKGFEILSDGTVLQKKTGLIWHRNPNTPGRPFNYFISNRSDISLYVSAFNSGAYGTDPLEGNAGHSDWRLPTIDELTSLTDHRFTNPAISDLDGGGTIYPAPRYGNRGGHQFGKPFFILPEIINGDPEPDTHDLQTQGRFMLQWYTSSSHWNSMNAQPDEHLYWDAQSGRVNYAGGATTALWLVRGP